MMRKTTLTELSLLKTLGNMFLSKVGLEDTGFDDIEEILGTDESGWGEEDEDGEDYEIPDCRY
jgi:hypothetical protein